MQGYTTNQLQHLFLQQSCLDAYSEYEKQIKNTRALIWDYVVLTASNEEQAEIYRSEIEYRLRIKQLPGRTKYLVLPDPDGRRVGSGGATFNVLKELALREQKDDSNFFKNMRVLVIHSGGDSKRIPQYSVLGKLFSPVPRVLPNGQASTLFDEFMITTAMIPSRMQEGMLIMSGDVLLLFNALQIDTQFNGAAAISIKEHVQTGKNHGVFLGDEKENVKRFLHKQSVERLHKLGAVNRESKVDLDTGAILLDCNMLEALYSLISTRNKLDYDKFNAFVNEKARISFYGDFLYPLAMDSTLDEYKKEAPEGEMCEELIQCREKLWQVLKDFQLKLICLSPAEFIHFGTTGELRTLVTKTVDDYTFLGWEHIVCANRKEEKPEYALHNTFLKKNVLIEKGAYVENALLSEGVIVEKGAVVSGLLVPEGQRLMADTVYHALKLKDGKFVVRIYGVDDNPKENKLFGIELSKIADFFDISAEMLFEDGDTSLWKTKLYPSRDTIQECMEDSIFLYNVVKSIGKTAGAEMSDEGEYTDKEIPGSLPYAKSEEVKDKLKTWLSFKRYSLASSFTYADGSAIIPWRENLEDSIRVSRFVQDMMADIPVAEALGIFAGNMRKSEQKLLLQRVAETELSEKIRIYYGMAKAAEGMKGEFEEVDSDNFMQACFNAISDEVSGLVEERLKDRKRLKIRKEQVEISLPVRVNWGGGWTDTPPHCQEKGGVVLNAAISLKGQLPIRVSVRKLPDYVIEFESQDIGAHGIFETLEEVNDCSNPYDKFALHKAALIACGIIRRDDTRDLPRVLEELGGGIYLSTQVLNVPKGSGLGTSSILAGACVKGIFEFLGEEVADEILYDVVLSMEQLMSTGGGWQDQVGGLIPGIKMITTAPGMEQKIKVAPVVLKEEVKQELQERFALIYTGQRRLARNLLREVVGGYIGNRTESLEALHKMKRVAAMMKFELEEGNVDGFASLMNLHWQLSIQLDSGTTNTCIEQIFLACEDLIDGKFIAGAGGGGFLQVILKKGVSKEKLRKRLYAIFQDSGVDVWECEMV